MIRVEPTNPAARPGTDVELVDGKTYVVPPLTLRQLRLHMPAIKQAATGHLEDVLASLDPIYAAFATNYPSVTRDEFEDLLTMVSVQRIMEIVFGLPPQGEASSPSP